MGRDVRVFRDRAYGDVARPVRSDDGAVRPRHAAPGADSPQRQAAAPPSVSILKPLAQRRRRSPPRTSSRLRGLPTPRSKSCWRCLDVGSCLFAGEFICSASSRARRARRFTAPEAAVNPKVAQLVGLEAVATGEICVISDSNVRVASGIPLAARARPRGTRTVGMWFTSLFVGTGEKTLGAAIENLHPVPSRWRAPPGLFQRSVGMPRSAATENGQRCWTTWQTEINRSDLYFPNPKPGPS